MLPLNWSTEKLKGGIGEFYATSHPGGGGALTYNGSIGMCGGWGPWDPLFTPCQSSKAYLFHWPTRSQCWVSRDVSRSRDMSRDSVCVSRVSSRSRTLMSRSRSRSRREMSRSRRPRHRRDTVKTAQFWRVIFRFSLLSARMKHCFVI